MLMGFAMDHCCRNCGVGEYLLEAAIDRIYRGFGVCQITPGMHKDNKRAAHFYERHGLCKTEVMEGNDDYLLRRKTAESRKEENDGNTGN